MQLSEQLSGVSAARISLSQCQLQSERTKVNARYRGHAADLPSELPAEGTNAIGHMLGLLGDEWNLFILGHALMGATGYAEFMSRIPISNWVLTNRLRTLVRDGLLTRHEHPTSRSRVEYQPTLRSRPLWPVFLSMWAWEGQWVTENPARKPPAMWHESCRRLFRPQLRCATCGALVTAADVTLAQGGSGDWSRSVPAASTRRRADHDPGLYPEMMRIFGNRWAAALVLSAFLGTTRFNEFQSQLGIPPSTLAERLQTFCAIGVLEVSPIDEGSQREEYVLSEKGRAVFPILVLLLNWAQQWFHSPEGPAITLQHNACGADLKAELACDQCFETLAGDRIQPRQV